MLYLSYIFIGLVTGILSGSLGIGGGLIIIPALTYIYGLSQHQAQGISLAMMVPPITLLAAIRYYQSGNSNLVIAAFLAVGFIAGGLLGAHAIQGIPDTLLRRIFAIFLLVSSIKMLISK